MGWVNITGDDPLQRLETGGKGIEDSRSSPILY